MFHAAANDAATVRLAWRDELQAVHSDARERFAAGASGLELAQFICARTDRVLVAIFSQALAALADDELEQARRQLAIVAVGGTGRGELAPYSDVDLLFLKNSSAPAAVDEAIARAVRNCWDAGLRLGHTVRTSAQALSAARDDFTFATALVESRRLWGSEALFEEFCGRFRGKVVQQRFSRFFRGCLEARDAERAQYGVSERRLEPDVKRSSGGLRDVHLIRWIGFALCGNPALDHIQQAGALSADDHEALRTAYDFVSRVRIDLHLAAGKLQDVLSREEQLRLAQREGPHVAVGKLPVERFMQSYFRHATAIADISTRFTARHRPRSRWTKAVRPLLWNRTHGSYLIRGGEIDIAPERHGEVGRDLESLLALYQLAAQHNARLSPELAERIREIVPDVPRDVSPTAGRTLLSILAATGNVGRQLRDMFASGLLEVVLPEIAHARCLMQFNQYHNYTVDEHSLRAVEIAEEFQGDPGPIGTACRQIKHRDLLHLSLLLHDLGKGYEGDHSEVGREIAAAVADRLGLTAPQRETLVFLVHKHLLMTQLALRRDLSDPELLARFSREVGSPETLRMLYVHTAADVSAVGRGAWTSWKADLIGELFERSMQVLSGGPSRFIEAERVGDVHRRVLDAAAAGTGEGQPAPSVNPPPDPAAFELRLATFPPHYLIATRPEQIADDLNVVAQIDACEIETSVRGIADAQTNAAEYRIITRDRAGSELFSRIAGALTAKGLQILSANICTTADGIVIDRFRVIDGDHAPTVPEFRLREVESAIDNVVHGAQSVEELFRRHRRYIPRADTLLLFREPTRVVIDSSFSEKFTIIDVFAHDRRGLLYAIAAMLRALNLSVTLAKVSTHVDQALDVFYVTDSQGGKIQDEQRIAHIREALMTGIEEFERRGLSSPVADV
jgi:[protein-PII] uridylyltransferase